jgi:excisionase family DNA binding protein
MEEFKSNGHLSFDQLPQAVSVLSKDVKRIISILEASKEPPSEPERWFDIDEFINYHPDKPKKPTAYGWVAIRKVPFHKSGKKLRFLKSEIDEWLKQGKVKTFAEVNVDADNYLKNKGGRI